MATDSDPSGQDTLEGSPEIAGLTLRVHDWAKAVDQVITEFPPVHATLRAESRDSMFGEATVTVVWAVAVALGLTAPFAWRLNV